MYDVPTWWQLAENEKGFKEYTVGRKFQRYTDTDYANVKIFAFQPHEHFAHGDKLRITIPLGSTQH